MRGHGDEDTVRVVWLEALGISWISMDEAEAWLLRKRGAAAAVWVKGCHPETVDSLQSFGRAEIYCGVALELFLESETKRIERWAAYSSACRFWL